jgi:phosphoglycerate dehydrogenase-like enzyme
MRIAILDDYAGIAEKAADWSAIRARAEVHVFRDALAGDAAVAALSSFDVLCTIRERMALPAALLERLPQLKLITIIGESLPNLDMAAATKAGILVCNARGSTEDRATTQNATPELAWGLILSVARHIPAQDQRMRLEGGWQSQTGTVLCGKTMGILGLGNLGRRVAGYAKAFGMEVIAWSQNLTDEAACEVGVRRVEKEAFFAQADVISIHMRLSARTRGLVAARELGLMKPSAIIVNTSRGPIIEEAALVAALAEGRIGGAGLDVFDQEPLPADHPLRSLPNVVLTPHLGYFTEETMAAFYGGTVATVAAFLDGRPVGVLNGAASS